MPYRHYHRGTRPGAKPQSEIKKSLSPKDMLHFLCCLILVCIKSCRFSWLDLCIQGAPVFSGVIYAWNQWTEFPRLLLLLRSFVIFICKNINGFVISCKTIQWDCCCLCWQTRQAIYTQMLIYLSTFVELIESDNELLLALFTIWASCIFVYESARSFVLLYKTCPAKYYRDHFEILQEKGPAT